MKRFLFLTALAVLLAPGHSGAVLADSSQKEAREALKRGFIRPLADVIAKVEKDYDGRVLDAEMEHEHGRYVYEIKLLTKDGWRRKLYLDANTLELVKEKKANPANMPDEKDKD